MTYPSARPKACPVCGATATGRFLRLKDVPLNCSALWYTREEGQAAARGTIELALCSHCGLIFNAAFDPARLEYDRNYDNTLSYSSAFRSYADDLAARLVSAHKLYNKDVIEIGCGNGDFLDRICDLGQNSGIGFDPSAEDRRRPGLPEIVGAIFSRAEADRAVDFVCCRHVLEHIEAPRELLDLVWGCLSHRKGSVYFEVPNASWVLGGPTSWDVIYPHCSYFTPPSLRYLFESSGFEVLRIAPTYGEQFLGIEARASGRNKSVLPDAKGVAAVSRLANRFDLKLREAVFRWSRFIEYASVEGRRVALWGAGAKSVTFLNVIPGAERVEFVVDLNPRKQGAFIPGTAQQVMAPATLVDFKPDVIIVLNPLYQAEIRQSVSSLGLDPLFTTDAQLPLPAPARGRSAAAGASGTIESRRAKLAGD